MHKCFVMLKRFSVHRSSSPVRLLKLASTSITAMAAVAVLLIAGMGSASASTSSASASAAVAATVKTTPATYTPYLLRSPAPQRVWELQQCGTTMYAVGVISAVGQGGKTYTRGNAFSFNAATGAMTTWDPQANGFVHSIALSPDCSTAYLGGKFTSVRGVAASNIVAVDAKTAAIRTGFAHSATNEVDTLQYTHGQVVAGGLFGTINGVARARFASLNPTSGAVTQYANLGITGTGSKIFNSQLSHSGDKMLVEGLFATVGQQPRSQIFMLDLGATSATVDNWTSNEFQPCVTTFYVRGAAWSPDDQTVYVATTGYKPVSGPGSKTTDPRAGLCDAAVAFPATSTTVVHKWINYTGCDSYYSVAASDTDVYVSGHERWANNPNGCDKAGPGALSRPGIASINPTTGLATSWNPTRSLGYGSAQLMLTSTGLWVASDTFTDGNAQKCGGSTPRGGICFFPN